MQPLPFLFLQQRTLDGGDRFTLVAGCFQQYSNGALSRIHRRQITGRTAGAWFLTQSFFTGFGITLANISLFVFQKIITGESIADDGQSGIPYWVYGSFCWCSLLNRLRLVSFQNPGNTANSRRTGKMKQHKGGLFDPVIEIISAIRTCPKHSGKSLVYLFNGMPCFATGSSFRIASQNRFGIPAWKKTNPSTKKPLVGLVSLTAFIIS